ncbi:MAG: encapsulin-associated ferritin-like protein [Acidimicrobiales bacterium]
MGGREIQAPHSTGPVAAQRARQTADSKAEPSFQGHARLPWQALRSREIGAHGHVLGRRWLLVHVVFPYWGSAAPTLMVALRMHATGLESPNLAWSVLAQTGRPQKPAPARPVGTPEDDSARIPGSDGKLACSSIGLELDRAARAVVAVLTVSDWRGAMAASSADLHEPQDRLSPEVIDRHRAIISVIEELEAIDWYDQRAAATTDPELAEILQHNRDEEKEHAAMTLEWLRRHDFAFDKQLRTYLFTDMRVLQVEEGAAGATSNHKAAGGEGSLGIGSLKEPSL